MSKKNEAFNIEYQYNLWCKKMNLNPQTMHPQQRIQLRQAFYGAFSCLLVVLEDDISPLPEMVAVGVLENLKQQCKIYWNNQLLTGGE